MAKLLTRRIVKIDPQGTASPRPGLIKLEVYVKRQRKAFSPSPLNPRDIVRVITSSSL
jgi:hypothetical protein